MAERPIAYTRYGDRDIYKDKIYKEHSNRGYRSQHYIVRFNGVYCEIQVRTLAEEVYGEFDHRVKYPYREDNKFLIRYTGTLAQLLDSVDELISTCEQLRDGWEDCGRYYDDDEYIDWTNISMKSEHIIEKESTDEYAELPEKMAEEVDEDGELLYGEAHIMCNLFSIDALDKVSKIHLPYHVAEKKSNYMNDDEEFIEVTEPNAYKFEAFIFHAFNFLYDISILRVRRENDFAPVKNKTGNDSPETSRELYNNYWKNK